MKRFLLFVLTAILFAPLALADGVEIDGVCYLLDSTNYTASVTYTGNDSYYNSYSGNIILPDTIEYDNHKYVLIAIGKNAFYNCKNLNFIQIPNSVVSIGEKAFQNCYSLSSVEIPNGVTKIDSYAFCRCTNLTSIAIPNSVTSIGYGAFRICSSLASMEIPSSVVSIEAWAFSGCISLVSIDIPSSVTSIGDCALSLCGSLRAINVADDNPSYTSIDGVLFNKDITTLMQCPGSKQGSYLIPNSVTSIGVDAFTNCSSLVSVEIPSSVTYIGGYAFSGCASLAKVYCTAIVPPDLDGRAFDNGSSTLFVPKESFEAYLNSGFTSYFSSIKIISEVTDITETTAQLRWISDTTAARYDINLYVDTSHIAQYIVDGNGQIISSQRYTAPSIYHLKQDTTTSSTDYFVISLDNLESGTDYTYTIESKDAQNMPIYIEEGSFHTAGYPTSIPIIAYPDEDNNQSPARKVMHDGKYCIVIDGKIYLLTGQEIK